MANTAFPLKFTTPCKLGSKCGIYHLFMLIIIACSALITMQLLLIMSGENVLATKTLEAMHAKILSFSMLGLIYILLPLGPRVSIQERE